MAKAMRLQWAWRLVLFCLDDGVHDPDDFALVIEQSAPGVAAAGGQIGLDEACLTVWRKVFVLPR